MSDRLARSRMLEYMLGTDINAPREDRMTWEEISRGDHLKYRQPPPGDPEDGEIIGGFEFLPDGNIEFIPRQEYERRYGSNPMQDESSPSDE